MTVMQQTTERDKNYFCYIFVTQKKLTIKVLHVLSEITVPGIQINCTATQCKSILIE